MGKMGLITVGCLLLASLGTLPVQGVPPLRPDLGFTDEFLSSEFHSAPKAKASPRYRLPRSVIPTHYDLEIRPILDEGYGVRFTAPGTIRMVVNCTENTNTVAFHAYTLNVTSVNVTNALSGQQIPVSSQSQDDNLQTYNLVLGSQFISGSQYVIDVEFVAPVPGDRTDGLYLSSYLNSNGERRYLTITDFEADDCRRMTPHFDEPDMKATWSISVIRTTNYHSLSNARLLESQLVDENWIRDVYEEVGPIPSYLVAIAVSDFENTTANTQYWNGRPVKIWGPPPLIQAGAGQYAPDISARILEYLEELFQTDTALLKMDKISIPDYNSGAMENWGLNTYRENRLLYLDGVSTIDDYVRMTNTISHEIVHQWFGNLVTMKWWNDLHLNEAFATYYAIIGVEHVQPDHLPLETFIINSVQPSMQADVLRNTHPVSDDSVEEEAEIAGMFSTITYHKGGSLLRMMDAFLGNETFLAGLAEYLRQFHFGNAVQNDLFSVLTNQAVVDGILPENVTVEAIMTSWTKQTGFPVVSVVRNVSANQLEFTQSKYFPTGHNSSVETKWYIPLTYTLKDETLNLETKEWMDDQTSSASVSVNLTDSTRYALVNPSQIGFYRVLYDPANFQLIQQQLAENHDAIDALSRSALIDDALNLGFAGYYSDLSPIFTLTTYLNNERDLVPWATFLTNMAHPYRMFGRTAAYSNFRNYILSLLREPLAAIQFERQENDTVGRQILLRTRLVDWACNLGDSYCVQPALEKFQNWTLDPSNNEIPPDLRPTIYCTAVANGGDTVWDFIVEQYRFADVGSPSKHLPDAARIALVRALGCARQSYRLAQLLDLALDYQSFLLPEHRVAALQAVAGNSAGVYLTFNFIRNNFETLVRRYGVGIFSSTVTTLSTYLNTQSDFNDLRLFIANNTDRLASAAASLQLSQDNVERNIAWMSQNYPEFRQWLESQGY